MVWYGMARYGMRTFVFYITSWKYYVSPLSYILDTIGIHPWSPLLPQADDVHVSVARGPWALDSWAMTVNSWPLSVNMIDMYGELYVYYYLFISNAGVADWLTNDSGDDNDNNMGENLQERMCLTREYVSEKGWNREELYTLIYTYVIPKCTHTHTHTHTHIYIYTYIYTQTCVEKRKSRW